MAHPERTEPTHADESLGLYWVSHAWLSALVPGYVVLLVGVFVFGVVSGSTGLLSRAETVEIGTTVVDAFVALWGVGAIVAYVVGAIGYYVEARRLEERGADWQPNWIAYLAVNVIVPVVVAPLYLVQRWRHVGLP